MAGVDATLKEPLEPGGLFGRGMRLVWSYIRAYPRPFLKSVLGAFLFAVASIAVTVALGKVTDRVLRPAFTSSGVAGGKIWAAVGVLMLFASVRAVGIGVRRYYSGVLGASVGAMLRDRVSDRYRDLALAYHRATPTGELLAHMEADVEAAVDVLY